MTFLSEMSQRCSFEVSQSQLEAKKLSQILILGKLVKNIKKLLKHNRIIGHCETILIHLTKVTKWLKENKYSSPKGTETHTICYQKGALLTERKRSNSSLVLAYLTKSIYLVNFNLNLVNPGLAWWHSG